MIKSVAVIHDDNTEGVLNELRRMAGANETLSSAYVRELLDKRLKRGVIVEYEQGGSAQYSKVYMNPDSLVLETDILGNRHTLRIEGKELPLGDVFSHYTYVDHCGGLQFHVILPYTDNRKGIVIIRDKSND